MSTRGFLDRSRIDAALAALGETWEVIAPVVGAGEQVPRLTALPADGRITLEARKPLLPLKTLLLPTSEELFYFAGRGPRITVTPLPALERDRVVVGALGCDVAALGLLDGVFLAEPVDESYRERRERTAIVAVACVGESWECFCASTGVDPLRPTGADAVLTPVANGYLVEARTERGERVVERIAPLLEEPEPSAIEAAASLASRSRGDVPMAPPPGGWSAVWDSPVWNELAARCLGCGVCTVLCPTCHCFDVQDDRRGDEGSRFRAWDSCMSLGFTRMASGDNPRTRRAARLRQRFLHKLSYFPERYGATACVGCGRCVRSCPMGIAIEEVAARIARATGGRHG